ncbi:MAG: hypothetical protein ACKVJK_00765 [Methylophagaceae bacterium]|jgi:hypothetical protein|tara:strand:+ start:223 stop:912 length:690 start_codon:yes stop_codon:yes gene_type:complete
MAVQLVNIGRIANDGTGDDLREAFVKINQSLEDLDLRIDDKTEGLNLGSGAGVFKQRTGYNLEYKSLVGSSDIVITNNPTELALTIDAGLAATPIVADTGTATIPARGTLRINGSNGITTTADDGTGTITIAGNATLASDTTPTLTANLNANGNAIINVGTLTGANVMSDVWGIDIRPIHDLYVNLDFGDIESNTDNFVDFFKSLVDADYGTLLTPILLNTDNGLLPTL